MSTLIITRGIYHNGQLSTDEPMPEGKPVEVSVTYAAAAEGNTLVEFRWEDFGFDKMQESLKDLPGNLSDHVIAERREGL
jgi:hypothetical protein